MPTASPSRTGRLAGAALLGVLPLFALAAQPVPDAARAAVEHLLGQQAAGLPGAVEVTVEPATLAGLPACPQPLQAFLPPGTRAWGRVSVGLRCEAAVPWSRFVRAHVAVHGRYPVAARGIEAGEPLAADAVILREGDLTALPGSVITDLSDLEGKTASSRVAAGMPLRRDQLRAALVVRQGQDVRVVVRGPGFMLATEGKAQSNAAVGGTVQVRTRQGQLLSGVARADGTVERPH